VITATMADVIPIVFSLFVKTMLQPSFAQYPKVAPMKKIGILAYVNIIMPLKFLLS
jgi:hypothetical protein